MRKAEAKMKRRRRVRAKVSGTRERPRLSVFRSNKYIRAQIIDDEKGETLVFAEDLGSGGLTKTERARMVGERLAELALNKKIKKVVFDKGANKYHGRVRALAEGAREKGLKF